MILLLHMMCCSIFCSSESTTMLFQMFQYRLNNHDCHFHVVSYQVLNTVYLQQNAISLETLDVSVEKPYMWMHDLTPTSYGQHPCFVIRCLGVIILLYWVMMCNMLLHVPSQHVPGCFLISQKHMFLVRLPYGNLNHNIHFIKFFITFNFMFLASGDTQEKLW